MGGGVVKTSLSFYIEKISNHQVYLSKANKMAGEIGMLANEYLYLRKMTVDDIPIYHKWRNDMEVMAYTSLNLDRYTYEETKAFVETDILDASHSKCYIIEEKRQQRPIGIISLVNMDSKNRNAELIIDIGEKSEWGKGIGTTAIQLILDYAFRELNHHRLSLKVFSLNSRAQHVYEKLGFIEEGRVRQCLFREGKWFDMIHMGLLHEEYMNGETI